MPPYFLKQLTERICSKSRWDIESPRKEILNGVCRVSARVDGYEVWYESAGVDLDPAIESFLAPFLMPALAKGMVLNTKLPVDAVWFEGMSRLFPIWHRWWGFKERNPLRVNGHRKKPRMSGASEALFFTCGVDSFHALLKGPWTEWLVFVQGFDIPLSDQERLQRCAGSVEAIAQALGRQALFVRTNLREHPLIAEFSWEQLHGSALASVGYLLGRIANTFRIASSDTGTYNVPWGTHQDVDSLFSTSEVDFQHWGESVHRADKVRTIASEPLVQRYLSVCWEHRLPTDNCSRCEKCLRTMFQLSASGYLEVCHVFDSSGAWWNRLDALHTMRGAPAQVYWEDLLSRDLSPSQHRAIAQLLAR